MNLFFSSLFTFALVFSLFSVGHMSCPSQAPKKPLSAIDGKTEEKGRKCTTRGGADESRGRRSLWSGVTDSGKVYRAGAGPIRLLSPPHPVCGFQSVWNTRMSNMDMHAYLLTTKHPIIQKYLGENIVNYIYEELNKMAHTFFLDTNYQSKVWTPFFMYFLIYTLSM